MLMIGFSFDSNIVQLSRSVMSHSLLPHELRHSTPSCPSPIPRVHLNPCPSSRWCHPTILSSVVTFSSCPQSFPASGSFPVNESVLLNSQAEIPAMTKTSLLCLYPWSIPFTRLSSLLPAPESHMSQINFLKHFFKLVNVRSTQPWIHPLAFHTQQTSHSI